MGAFDSYQSPKKESAFENYKPPPPTFDDSTFGGRLAHLWQNTKDEARVAGNTFGAYDLVAANPFASGYAESLKAERAKTAAASERLGPIDSAIVSAGGYLPLAAATGGAGLGPIATSAIGGALAGAGHSEATDPIEIGKDAATAAAINAATAGVITRGRPYGPAFLNNAVRHYVPRAVSAYVGSHFGPFGAWAGNEIARELVPARQAMTPTPSPSWLLPGLNTAVQGPLSAQGW